MGRGISHVIGFDDGPFAPAHRGDVHVVGVVYSGLRLEGVLSGRVRRDGVNATRVLVEMVRRSRFAPQLQLVLLQGIAFAGFNVVDLRMLHRVLGLPVLAVVRRRPDLAAVRRALLGRVAGGARKWALVEGAGPVEPVARVFVQRAGIDLEAAASVVRRFAVHGHLPEPLRVAHLIAGGLTTGESRHRP